jgi:hypothetical protein
VQRDLDHWRREHGGRSAAYRSFRAQLQQQRGVLDNLEVVLHELADELPQQQSACVELGNNLAALVSAQQSQSDAVVQQDRLAVIYSTCGQLEPEAEYYEESLSGLQDGSIDRELQALQGTIVAGPSTARGSTGATTRSEQLTISTRRRRASMPAQQQEEVREQNRAQHARARAAVNIAQGLWKSFTTAPTNVCVSCLRMCYPNQGSHLAITRSKNSATVGAMCLGLPGGYCIDMLRSVTLH